MKLTDLKQFTMVGVVILLVALCVFWVQKKWRTISLADSAPAAVPSASAGQVPVLAKDAAAPLSQPPGTPSVTNVRTPPRASIAPVSATKSADRLAVVNREALLRWGSLSAGDAVSLPLMDGRVMAGRVNLVKRDEAGWVRVAGELSDGGDGFFVNINGTAVSGLILLRREKLAYELEEQKDGKLAMLEKRLGDVVCDPMPRMKEPALAPRAGLAAAPPILNSRPGLPNVIYLDFDGETVTDPDWNNGNTIVAASYDYSEATINEIFDRVKEDWFPFRINVTTDVANYNSAAIGHRMRVIITPTDTASPGAGGVAYPTSFRNGGLFYSSTIPCWVFNSSVIGVSETISHEVGHTMGLFHDGRDNVPGIGV